MISHSPLRTFPPSYLPPHPHRHGHQTYQNHHFVPFLFSCACVCFFSWDILCFSDSLSHSPLFFPNSRLWAGGASLRLLMLLTSAQLETQYKYKYNHKHKYKYKLKYKYLYKYKELKQNTHIDYELASLGLVVPQNICRACKDFQYHHHFLLHSAKKKTKITQFRKFSFAQTHCAFCIIISRLNWKWIEMSGDVLWDSLVLYLRGWQRCTKCPRVLLPAHQTRLKRWTRREGRRGWRISVPSLSIPSVCELCCLDRACADEKFTTFVWVLQLLLWSVCILPDFTIWDTRWRVWGGLNHIEGAWQRWSHEPPCFISTTSYKLWSNKGDEGSWYILHSVCKATLRGEPKLCGNMQTADTTPSPSFCTPYLVWRAW